MHRPGAAHRRSARGTEPGLGCQHLAAREASGGAAGVPHSGQKRAPGGMTPPHSPQAPTLGSDIAEVSGRQPPSARASAAGAARSGTPAVERRCGPAAADVPSRHVDQGGGHAHCGAGHGHGRAGIGREAGGPRPFGHGGHPRRSGVPRSNRSRWKWRPGVRRLGRRPSGSGSRDAFGGGCRVRAHRQRNEWRSLAGCALRGRREQPEWQDRHRYRQPARLLERLPTDPLRQGHRVTRGGDPGGLPAGTGGQGTQHPHRRTHGPPE